jgi:hypothetical protein
MNIRSASLMALCLCAASQTYAQDGSSCGNAIRLVSPSFLNVDTTAATNWMTVFGPLPSPSNDIVYTFTLPAGVTPTGSITPTAANYPFALYLVPGCSDLGAQPVPIGATATVGRAIDVTDAGVTGGNTYYLAVTGTAAGGPGANGTVSIDINITTPVTLQSFTVD